MHRSLRLGLTLSLLVVAACDRGGGEPSAPGEATGPAEMPVELAPVAERQEEIVISSAPARPEVVPVTGVRPDALIETLPNGGALVALDLRALEVWAATGPIADGASDRSREVVEAAVVSLVSVYAPGAALDLGETTGAAAWTWTETGLALAVDAPPAQLVGGAAEPIGDATVVRFGAAIPGTATVPDTGAAAVATAIVVRPDVLPDRVANSLDFLGPLGMTRLAVGISGDGSIEATIDADDPERIESALGRGQAFVSQALGQLRMDSSPAMQGWVTYANRITQAVFARVDVIVDGGRATLTVPPPTCGGALRNLAAAAFVLAVADVAAGDARTPSVPYVAMTADYADDCGPVEGPASTIPVSAARFGSHDDGLRSILVVIDLPAVLRAGLPTLFGVLPFAITDAAVTDAFGSRPMGLTGLDDPAGQVVFVRERGASDASPAQQALIVPASLTSLVSAEGGVDTMQPFVTPALVGYTTPGIDPAARSETQASPVWDRAIGLVPEGALAVAVVNGEVLGRWAEHMGDTDPTRAIVNAAESMVAVVSASGLSVGFVGAPAGVGPQAVRDALPASLASLSGVPGPSPEADGRMAAATAAVDSVTVRVVGDVVWIDADGPLLPLVGAAVRLGAPMFAGISGRGPVGMPPIPPGMSFPR